MARSLPSEYMYDSMQSEQSRILINVAVILNRDMTGVRGSKSYSKESACLLPPFSYIHIPELTKNIHKYDCLIHWNAMTRSIQLLDACTSLEKIRGTPANFFCFWSPLCIDDIMQCFGDVCDLSGVREEQDHKQIWG
jgi:hypothetical protein